MIDIRIKLSLASLHQFQYRYLKNSKVDFVFPKRFSKKKRSTFNASYASFVKSFETFQINLISP